MRRFAISTGLMLLSSFLVLHPAAADDLPTCAARVRELAFALATDTEIVSPGPSVVAAVEAARGSCGDGAPDVAAFQVTNALTDCAGTWDVSGRSKLTITALGVTRPYTAGDDADLEIRFPGGGYQVRVTTHGQPGYSMSADDRGYGWLTIGAVVLPGTGDAGAECGRGWLPGKPTTVSWARHLSTGWSARIDYAT